MQVRSLVGRFVVSLTFHVCYSSDIFFGSVKQHNDEAREWANGWLDAGDVGK